MLEQTERRPVLGGSGDFVGTANLRLNPDDISLPGLFKARGLKKYRVEEENRRFAAEKNLNVEPLVEGRRRHVIRGSAGEKVDKMENPSIWSQLHCRKKSTEDAHERRVNC